MKACSIRTILQQRCLNLMALMIALGTICLMPQLTMAQATDVGKAAALPQDGLVVRPPPQPVDEFETDIEPADGRPEGWYNDRGASLIAPGHASDRCLRLENDKPGRPARISKAFGVDGRKFRALRFAAWVRVKNIGNGEHHGEDPGVLIDFLDAGLLTSSRSNIGPFNSLTVGEDQWFYVSKMLPVKSSTRDAIMTVGLMGATGTFEIDRLELELIPRDVTPVENLVANHQFELGDLKPEGWVVEGSAHRTSTGYESVASLEFGRGTGRALTGLAKQVSSVRRLKLSLVAKSQGLRSGGNGGGYAAIYFVDERGANILNSGTPIALKFSGSGSWNRREALLEVPSGAVGAILQIDKTDAAGTLMIDAVTITDADNPANVQWRPGDVPLTDDSDAWPEYKPVSAIEPGSVLDTTQWGLAQPKGRLSVKNGRLVDADGVPARLWGVSLLPTAGFPNESNVAKIADNLARLGVNVVRFGDLDYAFGPGRSLIDDVFEDTSEIDPVAWARMDRFQAELAKRGIYYSFEMHSQRRFRVGDGIQDAGTLPSGGGPAAIFDNQITKKIDDLSMKILKENRPVSQTTLADDPHLAWVTEMGEISMIELETGQFTPSDRQIEILKQKQKLAKTGNTRKMHRLIESERAEQWARLMRSQGLKAPIAGVGHWQRDADWLETLSAPGLSVIEDRFYWPVQPWSQPGYRGALFDSTRSIAALVTSKRKPDMAYVIGQWCAQMSGGWSLPTESADILFGAYAARTLDVDALIRRGLAQEPQTWGAAATGTSGDRDIFQLSESLSGMPQALAMMPHVSSILRRGRSDASAESSKKTTARTSPRSKPIFGKSPIDGWEPADGLLKISTPYTVGLVGRIEFATPDQISFGFARFESSMENGVIVASSATEKTLESTGRMLVSLLGSAIPSGFRYADHWQKDVAEMGSPPLRIEPVSAKLSWTGSGTIRIYQVDNNGHRGDELESVEVSGAQVFTLDNAKGGPHWEVEIKR